MNTEYKGFTIFAADRNGSGVKYYVSEHRNGADLGFKYEGYATLNNAKVAITKHLQAQAAQDDFDSNNGVSFDSTVRDDEWNEADKEEQEYFDRWPDVTDYLEEQDYHEKTPKPLQAHNEDKVYARMDMETESAVEAVRGLAERIAQRIAVQQAYEREHKAFIAAQGMTVQSRNKREGRYIGCKYGCHMRQGLYNHVPALKDKSRPDYSQGFSSAEDLFKAMGV